MRCPFSACNGWPWRDGSPRSIPVRLRSRLGPRPREVVMAEGLLERLARGPVLGDGGYLLELEKRGYVQAGPFTPEVSITNPEALAELHREFLRAGAEVL